MRALQQLVQATSNVLAGPTTPFNTLKVSYGLAAEGSGWNVRF